ncbi:hypothetical protein VULLAG_LOCUS2530 [Vulpes lagopus]
MESGRRGFLPRLPISSARCSARAFLPGVLASAQSTLRVASCRAFQTAAEVVALLGPPGDFAPLGNSCLPSSPQGACSRPLVSSSAAGRPGAHAVPQASLVLPASRLLRLLFLCNLLWTTLDTPVFAQVVPLRDSVSIECHLLGEASFDPPHRNQILYCPS